MTHDPIANVLPGAVYPEWMQAIEQRYRVLGTIILHRYDYRLDQLEQLLATLKKSEFAPEDRIVIVHFDSDYYIQHQYGVDLMNLFAIWQHLDLPVHTMLIYTNHMGIQREVDQLCAHADPEDRPTIVETFLNPLSYDPKIYEHEPSIDVDKIQYHGLCMMAHARSYRYALYNLIKHLSTQLVMNIRAPK